LHQKVSDSTEELFQVILGAEAGGTPEKYSCCTATLCAYRIITYS
jgi:hypothetical protein